MPQANEPAPLVSPHTFEPRTNQSARKRKSTRVLLIAPSLEIVGGQSIQADALLRIFRHQSNVEMVFAPTNPKLPAWVRKLKYVRTLLNFCVFLPLVAWRTLRSDILHIFTPAYTSYFFWAVPAMAIGRMFGKKVLLHYHDGRCGDHLSESRLAVFFLRLAHTIVVPSRYLVDVFAQYNVHAIAVPNIVETSQFRFRDRRPRLRPAFFTNRGLEPLYNVGCVLRAFARIQEKYPEAELTVAHDGSCRAELEQLARTLQLQHVSFVGKVSQERMAELYDAADIYMMSPDIDNMPGTVLECFASGLPVVSTNAGGIPYIVNNEKTGLLVNCGDDEALANAACRLLAAPVFAHQMTMNARAECAAYRGAAILPQWLRLYQGMMERHSRNAAGQAGAADAGHRFRHA